MTEAALDALQVIFTPGVIFYLFGGVAFGLFLGFVPGLGGLVGLSLLLPFVMGMDTSAAISMMIGLMAVTQTSDSFPAILIGVPGTSGSQATVLDGYALSQQGQASRALGAAFSASLFGGVFGAIALMAVLTVLRPLVNALGTPHLFMLTVLGLVSVGVLVRGDVVLGVCSAGIGMMLATVGVAPAIATERYTFGTIYLYDGMPLIAVAMGLFAIPEILSLLVYKTSVAKGGELEPGGLMRGLRDTIRNPRLVMQGSLLGVGVGAVPGLGASVVDWLAYGLAKQTLKNTEGFGKGDIRGVIAPESANNAKEGGALIPALIVGIPGSGATAILLGGLILMGITPGPDMVNRNLDIILVVIWSLVIANILATSVCFGLSRWVARITVVPAPILAPLVIVALMGSVFQASRHWGDILVMVLLGLFAFGMKLVGWPRAPALIGFVLAPMMERYLYLSISRYGGEWLLFPGVIAIMVVVIAMLLGPFVGEFKRRRRAKRAFERQDSEYHITPS